MIKKHFYSHLVESSNLTLEIANLEIDSNERVHLLSLAHANIHSVVISDVLSNLSEEDKKIFLKNISEENHEKTWQHLNSKLKDAQEKVRASIEKITKELLADVKEIQNIKD